MPDRTCSCSVRVNAQLHQSSRAADARTRTTSMAPRQPTRCAASARCWPSDSADDARIDDGSGILGRLDVGIACSNFLHIRSNSLSRTALANAMRIGRLLQFTECRPPFPTPRTDWSRTSARAETQSFAGSTPRRHEPPPERTWKTLCFSSPSATSASKRVRRKHGLNELAGADKAIFDSR